VIHHHLAAKAASCSTGSWLQRWKCGWNQPASHASAQAGYDFGHNVLPVLIVLAFVLLLASSARKRRAARETGRAPAKAPARR
jgi:hypothetical protein